MISNAHQQKVWDSITKLIEEMPRSGIASGGNISDSLLAEQRTSIKAVRRARLRAIKALENETIED